MRLELQLGFESMDLNISSASTGRRRRAGSGDPARHSFRATRGSKGLRSIFIASVDEQVLGCSVPRRGRTRGTGGRAAGGCTWQTSKVLQLALLEDEDEREALEALCFLSASSCQLEDQAVQAQLASNPASPKQLQQGQHSKDSSFTAEAAAAGPPAQLSSGWLAAAAGTRQPSPGSDVSSDGCQGALLAPQQQQHALAAPLDVIHPGAHPVEVGQLALAGAQQQHQAGRKGSRKQQQPNMSQVLIQQQQQQQQQHSAMAFEPLAHLHQQALLAAAAAGQPHQQAVHAPVAAAGLHQPLLQAQLASLLQANSYDAAAAAAAAAGFSNAQAVAPFHVPQQPQQQPGLSELLGLLSVGLPHAGVQQQQLPLAPLLPMGLPEQQPAPAVPAVPAAVKRPPVKGCYWHVYIANMIAAGRKEQEAKEQQQQIQHNIVTACLEQQQQQLQGLPLQRKSSSSSRLADAAEGGSPCKRQKRQESPTTSQQQQQQQQAMAPQLQLPPAAPLPNWLAAAGVLPPSLALAAAAAAASATGQAGILPQLLQAPALSGPLAAAAAAASSMGLLGAQGPASLPLLGMPAAATAAAAALAGWRACWPCL